MTQREARIGLSAPSHRVLELGWTLIVCAFLLAAYADPVTFATTDEERLIELFPLTYICGVAVFLGLYLLVLGGFAQTANSPRSLRVPHRLALIGAVLSLAEVLYRLRAVLGWLTPLGTLFLTVSALWFLPFYRGDHRRLVQTALGFMAFGFAAGLLLQLAALAPGAFESWLGTVGDVDQMMLRLGRAAAIAMPALALLFQAFVEARAGARRRRHARGCVLYGGGLLAVFLLLASLLWSGLIALVVVSAVVLFLGVAYGAILAASGRYPTLERAGWASLTLSMAVGLLVGAFAFEIIPQPNLYGEYFDLPRRYVRAGHVYLNVLGVVGVYVSRALGDDPARRAVTAGLLVFGLLTEILLILQWTLDLPTWTLAIGPLGVAATMTRTAVARFGEPAFDPLSTSWRRST